MAYVVSHFFRPWARLTTKANERKKPFKWLGRPPARSAGGLVPHKNPLIYSQLDGRGPEVLDVPGGVRSLAQRKNPRKKQKQMLE